jgi:hypothetical protein
VDRLGVKVKLADGKERTIQHMRMTSFWHPDGTPMSAHQFMELLFGKVFAGFQKYLYQQQTASTFGSFCRLAVFPAYRQFPKTTMGLFNISDWYRRSKSFWSTKVFLAVTRRYNFIRNMIN